MNTTNEILINDLIKQFNIAWKLGSEYYFPLLTDEMCLWEPSKNSWNVRLIDGLWKPDFSFTEPIPTPTPTIGWITWHVIWWWSGLISCIEGKDVLKYSDVFWPGNALDTVSVLNDLKTKWLDLLGDLKDSDLDKLINYPSSSPRTIREVIYWSNIELMKNISEIGYIKNLFDNR